MTAKTRQNRLHAVGQARHVSARHAGARGGPQSRRRCRFGLRRARHSAVAARSRLPKATSPSTPFTPVPSTCRRSAKWRPVTASGANAARWLRAVGSAARHRFRATWSSTCRPRARCTGRWCARAPSCATSRSIPAFTCTTSRSKKPDMHDPSGDLQRLLEALDRDWQLDGLDVRPRACCRELQAALRKGEWKVTVAVHERLARHRGLAGIQRDALRAGDRHRLDDDCRAPVQSDQRRGGCDGRHHEPADSLRRRPDEPRVLRDDEPGRRVRIDARSCGRASTT